MDVDTFQNALALSVSVCTILQFLSGVPVCRKIIDRGSTGDIPAYTFTCGFLSTCLWLGYGYLVNNSSVIYVNIVGVVLFLSYVVTYWYYNARKILPQLAIAINILFIIGMYATWYHGDQKIKDDIGILCCIVTVIFFGSPLLSAIHVINVKNTNSLPFPMILANFIVATQWFIYGVLLKDRFIQIPNFLGSVLTLFQLSLFYMYPNVPTKKYQVLETVENV